jgi:prepilin-type N-terminal cleavage/methylation domain-containing protein
MPTRKNQLSVKKEKGFTLIELLIAVAILGILSSIAISAYRGYISMAKKESAKSVLEQFPILIEQYRAEAEDARMCPDCNATGNYTYTYEENDDGTVITGVNKIMDIYPEFRAKSATATSATLYHYQVAITVTNCPDCIESATFTAIPQTGRGAPAGNIVSNPYQ